MRGSDCISLSRFQAYVFQKTGSVYFFGCMLAQPCYTAGDVLRLTRAYEAVKNAGAAVLHSRRCPQAHPRV